MQSVIAILDAIRSGRTTPTAEIAAAFDRIAAADGDIGAFAALAERGPALAAQAGLGGPLAGIAVGIKDIFDTYDLPTTYGTAIHAGHRPATDAALVSMFRDAGATIIGKTVSTEFAFLHPAATRNPRNTAHTPGGSSSGSAAAIAAGMIPAATGTQTGGSIIRPAAYCGVAGYKPSFRLLPAVGAKAFSWTLDTMGLFAASVADVARLAALLTGRSLDAVPLSTPPRIGLYRGAIWSQAEPQMRDAIERAARLARAAGATIVEIEEPEALPAGREAHATVQNFEAGLALADDLRRHGGEMSDILRTTLSAGRAIRPDTYDAARGVARRARKAATALFQDVDALLTPSATGPAPAGLSSTGSPVFNKLWTLTGNPCVNVPGLVADDGLPLGIQVVARFGADATALSVGHWLEQALAAD